MSTREEAREAMTQQRQHEKNLQQTMLHRSEAELTDSPKSEIQQTARERMTEQRQQEEHLHQSMLNRSVAEVNPPTQADTPSQTQ